MPSPSSPTPLSSSPSSSRDSATPHDSATTTAASVDAASTGAAGVDASALAFSAGVEAIVADEPRYERTAGVLNLSLVLGMPVSRLQTTRQMAALAAFDNWSPTTPWVATFLKSGTTLMQDIVKRLLAADVDEDASPLRVSAWPEIDERVPALGCSLEVAARAKVLKSHWPFRDHMVKIAQRAPVIYVVRHGLDACVSAYHHVRGFPLYAFDGDVATYHRLWSNGDVENGSWFEHVASWLTAAADPANRVLVVYYEDLLDDAKRLAIIRSIAKHIGVQRADDDEYRRIAAATAFGAMKARVQLEYDGLRSAHATPFMRRGVAGDGAAELGDEVVRS